ncbi:MAG: hypothetical protein GXO89_10415 [Chlorobi bacterium]|nr:hypothetical protein [Chlorobiota bacterium]
MKKYFYNSIIFRLAAPPLFGILIYLLILMFFDSVNMLTENFFSREVLFSIGLTYLFFEGNRLVIVILNKTYPATKDLKLRILIQYLFSILITVLIISSVLYAYFTYIEGFNTIRTELVTFNSIYVFTAVFYNLFFFSLVFLNKKNESKVNKEKALRKNLEIELRAFKNQVNPELLFQSLEVIIGELHRDKKSADGLIDNLSKIYRYTLDNKNDDLVTLKQEIDSLKPIYTLFRAKYGQSFSLDIKIDDGAEELNLIPGTLQLLMEFALSENIITKYLPLDFKISNHKNQLQVCYKLNKRIIEDNPVKERLDFLFRAYVYYSEKSHKMWDKNGMRYFGIPLIEVGEE